MLQCYKCNLTKDLECFNKDNRRPRGYQNWCRKCKAESYKKTGKIYRENNKSARNVYNKLWREENKEHLISYNKQYKQHYYYNGGKEIVLAYQNEYTRERRKTDPTFKLTKNMRTRLYNALKGNSKSLRTFEVIGCSPEQLKKYLESKFVADMNWINYGEWHVDHIVPLSKFNLTNPDELKKACHYINLQPLWAADNFLKGNK
jgi:hypothetical protein